MISSNRPVRTDAQKIETLRLMVMSGFWLIPFNDTSADGTSRVIAHFCHILRFGLPAPRPEDLPNEKILLFLREALQQRLASNKRAEAGDYESIQELMASFGQALRDQLSAEEKGEYVTALHLLNRPGRGFEVLINYLAEILGATPDGHPTASAGSG